MSELPANSKEENSPQDNDDSNGECETDEYFGDDDSGDKKQEELVDDFFNNKSINSIIIPFLLFF
ncbi:hypothetical protein CXB51_015044 [Gossypium anomalum]|uniref:Uncharacterized protein n=1 Tax=Gossypium anomalum TaxID=47600 RepID=A0A8J5YKT9_9ROSI|nr:hypothetical protein CXB51_015044 [Gossypium anomalum]